MSTPLINVASGHYDATYNALALGKTEDGWEIDIIHKGMIVTAEEWAENELDLIGRGAQIRIRAILKEWDSPGLMSALWGSPAFSTGVNEFGEMLCVGESAVRGIDAQGNTRAKALVLTAGSCHFNKGSVQGEGFYHGSTTSGISDLGLGVITFHRTILTPDSISKINLNNKPRVVPVEFMAFFTQIDTGNTRFLTVT
jgi:hypothetical protein